MLEVQRESTFVLRMDIDAARTLIAITELALNHAEGGNAEITYYGNNGVGATRGRALAAVLRERLVAEVNHA